MPSGDIIIEEDLCDIMLRPVREVSERKRQRNKNLHPGNQCITGKVFLDAVNSEKERKRREKEEKDEKKKERARLAEEKKRKLDERKEKKVKKVKKSKLKKSKAAADRYLEELSVYTRTSCGIHYDPDVDDPWVECDYCEDWYHVRCTSLPVLDDLGDNVDFTCKM